jgi:hypothetical protein
MKSQAWLASRGCTGLGQSSMEVIEARLRCRTTLPAAVRTRWEVPTNKLVGYEEQRPTHCTDGGATLIYRWGRLSRTAYDFKLSGAGIRRWVVRYSFPRYICWQCKTTFHQHAHQTKYGKYPFNDEMKEIGRRFAGLPTPIIDFLLSEEAEVDTSSAVGDLPRASAPMVLLMERKRNPGSFSRIGAAFANGL